MVYSLDHKNDVVLLLNICYWLQKAILFISDIGSGYRYFASRGKRAPSYFAIWRQDSPKCYFASSAEGQNSLNPNPNPNLNPYAILALTLTLSQ